MSYQDAIEIMENIESVADLAQFNILTAEPVWVDNDMADAIRELGGRLSENEPLDPQDLLSRDFALVYGYAFIDPTWVDQTPVMMVHRIRQLNLTHFRIEHYFTKDMGEHWLMQPTLHRFGDRKTPADRGITATLRLARQKIISRKQITPDRGTRRRAKRKGFEVPRVSVIQLRRFEPKKEGESSREFSHRWLVHGFWRKQWYPSLQDHRDIYINDYVKGPKDKPFIAKDRAFEIIR